MIRLLILYVNQTLRDAVFTNRLPLRTSKLADQPSGSFVAVPWALLCGTPGEPAFPQLWIYQAALDQARAVVRPSLPERDLLGVWN
jgi:hypothetical protein